jgi:hypothetical protein
MTDPLVYSEAAKRDRRLDPLQHWQMLQQAAAFFDSQQPVPRNSRAGCLANQARLLANLRRSTSLPSK